MRGFYIILAFVAILGLMAWHSTASLQSRFNGFTLQVTAPASLNLDSVQLLVVDDDYHQLRNLGTKPLGNVKAEFKGQLDSAQIAMLKFAGSDSLFYFILEPTLTTVTVSKQQVEVWGGKLNQEYFSIVARRHQAMGQRKQLWRQYAAHLADTTLTAKLERRLWMADSLLRERIQAATVRVASRPDVVGRLYRDRYFSTLDTLHMRQVGAPPK